MPNRPKPKGSAKYLAVQAHPWERGRTYTDKDGKKVVVKTYQECREYANKNGYTGIRINEPC